MLALLLLVVAALAPGESSIVGSGCQVSPGVSGICTSQSDCPWALQELRQNRRPKTCLKALPTVIVCCPRQDSSKQDASSDPQEPGNGTQAVGDVARKKCQEYADYVYQEEEVKAFINRRERISQCASSSDSLIVGGRNVRPKEYPHMALLGCNCHVEALECDDNGKTFFCGGSLISPDFVLTAAHCLYVKNKPVQLVQLGLLDRNASNGRQLGVAELLAHPEYRPDAKYHDVALVRLAQPAVMSGHVRPACLHTGEAFGAQVPVATGWGYTDQDDTELSDVLKKVGLRLVDDDTCRRSYADLANKTSLSRGIDLASQLCAGGEAQRDTCYGDSGGPLQVFTGKHSQSHTEPFCMYRIVGITSFSRYDCALVNVPGVYARVAYYVSWIENTVWPKKTATTKAA